MLNIGKIPNDMLESILKTFSSPARKEVLSRPAIGEDCAILDFDGKLCVATTDPITAAEEDLGALAVHIACNDLASSGAEPVGLMVTILAPPSIEFEMLSGIMDQIKIEASSINADIIGGHTEVTDAVNRVIVSITALGKAEKGKVVTTSGARPDDSIILTKYAGTEGTAILANMYEKLLQEKIGIEGVQKAKKLIGSISVLKEGLISAGFGASSMHDVTEGGVLGAVWELCNASKYGARIYKDKIPIMDETKQICAYLGIDPLKLISSGCMLIACNRGKELVELLTKNGVQADIIGEMTEEFECIMMDGNKVLKVEQPESDELYKAKTISREAK